MGITKRDNRVDIVKALAIIAVVISHTDSPFNNFVTLFHVGVFFIASGLFFKEEYTCSIRSLFLFVLKKLKGLYLPFAIWNIIFVVFQNLFLSIGFYSSDINVLSQIGQEAEDLVLQLKFVEVLGGICRALLFAGGAQLGGPMWFLRILFQVTIAYASINYFFSKITNSKKQVICVQGVISLIFLVVGDCFRRNNITVLGIGKTFTYYSLFFIGHFFAFLGLDEKEIVNKRSVNAGVSVISFIILVILNCKGTVSYSAHRYPDFFFLIIAALFGWLLLWGLAFFIKQWSFSEKIFGWIGRRSLIIMILHVLCFKIISAVYIICTNKEWIYLAAFPSIEGIGAWWILYVIVGIGISLLIDLLIEKIRFFLRSGK